MSEGSIIIVCSVCGEEFRTNPRRSSARKHCSTACYGQSQRGQTTSRRRPLLERFLECADVRSDEPESCWLWTGTLDTSGYGIFKLDWSSRGCNVVIRSSRASYLFFVGTIPQGSMVLHRCDTPACVNPRHLFLGTHQDNVDDKMSKGRHRTWCGKTHGGLKLSLEDVQTIRRLYAQGGWTYKALGKRFGISDVMVGKIIRNELWAE